MGFIRLFLEPSAEQRTTPMSLKTQEINGLNRAETKISGRLLAHSAALSVSESISRGLLRARKEKK